MKKYLFLLFSFFYSHFLLAQAPSIIWDKTIGGNGQDLRPTMITTSDGGFVIVGQSPSDISGDKSEANKGGNDYWVVKLNSNGQKVWDKTIGGNGLEETPTITATSDGGLFIAGTSSSNISGDKSEANKGMRDYWVVKLNSNGQKVWDKTIGGNYSDIVSAIIATNDGGFAVAGSSNSSMGYDKSESSPANEYAYWIVRFNGSGQKLWDKTFAGSRYDIHNVDVAKSIITTSDGGFVIAGTSSSDISGDKSEARKGSDDYWVIKLNSNGQKVWDKTIGGSGADDVTSIITTTDGGFVVVGTSSSSISGDKTEASKGYQDYWIVKLNSNGQKVWDKTIGGSK